MTQSRSTVGAVSFMLGGSLPEAAKIAHLEKASAKLRKEFEQYKQSSHAGQGRQNSNAPAKRQKAADPPRDETTHGTAKPFSQLDPTRSKRNYWDEAFRKWKQVLKLVGTLSMVGCAVITFFQWRDVRRNFIEEQAPIVGLEPQEPVLEENKPITWSIKFANYGHSPALRVRSCISLAWGKRAIDQMHEMSLDICRKTGLNVDSAGVTALPNAPARVMTITYPSLVFHEQDRPFLMQEDNLLAAQGVFQYEDSGGNQWVSEFCVTRLADGTIPMCKKYNNIRRLK